MAGIPKRIFPLKRRRKRIRGFRRFLLEHQQRAAVPAVFDIDFLRQTHRDSEKLGLAPWAVNEKPPLLIRQLWVEKLVADFQNFHQQLAAHYADFYLALWLYEPEFGRSQLVAGVEEKQAWYEGLWDETLDVPLPDYYQTIPGVAALHWTARPEVVSYWADEFAELPARIRQKPHQAFVTPAGEDFFEVQIGWVWVGQWPGAAR